jgi:hypothetical protein
MHRVLPRSTNPAWIDAGILVGAGFFIFALFLSSVFDPKIRLLHFLQSLIYVAVIFLSRHKSAWGFGAGVMIGAFWNYINLFVTTFIKAGTNQFVVLLQTGHLHRPDLLVAVVAAAGHFVLIAACLVGFLRTRPNRISWGQFIAGGVIAVAYFLAIIFIAGPQYIGLVRRIFHL